MPHVETCLKEKAGCFIVVGAAHLVGPDGLPTLLDEKGLQGYAAVKRSGCQRERTFGPRANGLPHLRIRPESRRSWHPA